MTRSHFGVHEHRERVRAQSWGTTGNHFRRALEARTAGTCPAGEAFVITLHEREHHVSAGMSIA